MMAIAPYNPDRNISSIVFVDGSLADLQAILSGLDPSVTTIVLDPTQDGIQQMADALAGMNGLDAIHVISHGSSGQVNFGANLGATQLSQDTLARYQNQLATIGQALSATGDLLLYGCNVAQGSQGQAFISALASATGADVAASTDLTGNTLFGGNWQLEAATGAIQANTVSANIAGVLAVIDGTAGNDTLTGTVNDDTIYGNSGDDTLDGDAGNDTLYGGDGNDYLSSHSFGIAGNDFLYGEAGNDILFVAGTSGMNESVWIDGGDGDDLIQTALSQTYGYRTLTATGGPGIDTYQFTAYKFISGDTIAGYTVTDFTAGAGGDRIDVTALLAFYSLGYTGGDPFSAANGYLRLIQSGTDTLFQYDDDGAAGTAHTFHTALILQGVVSTALTPWNYIGILDPNSADALAGNGGMTPLNITSGTITLVDVAPGVDIINISSGATAGQSLTVATASYATNTTNNGTLVIYALPTTASTITGSPGNDIITGSSADDILDGGPGNDTLNGGAGNDTYYVDSTGDSVVETSSVSGSATLGFKLGLDLSGNIDKVIASISYTLGDNLENLDLAAGSGNLSGAGNALDNVLTGNEGNNTLTGGAGNDSLDGGAGIDSASYAGNRASFTLAQSGSGFTVTDATGAEGVDTVTGIERLVFADTKIALDITGGNAGTTAKILGAVFGAASVSSESYSKQYVGIGLGYLDGGTSYQDLMLLALNERLGAGFSNADEVNLLYHNLVGALPSAADLDYWTGTLASGQFTQASLAVMAADHSLNTTNIDLTGLAQTGIEFA